MRPQPIIWFERIIALSFVLGLVNVGLYWRQFVGPDLAWPRFAWPRLAIFWTVQGVYFGVYALLIWLIARRGNTIARWLFAILAIAAAAIFVFLALPPPHWPTTRLLLTTAQCLLSPLSLIFIFGPDTRCWFDGRAPVDPEVFR